MGCTQSSAVQTDTSQFEVKVKETREHRPLATSEVENNGKEINPSLSTLPSQQPQQSVDMVEVDENQAPTTDESEPADKITSHDDEPLTSNSKVRDEVVATLTSPLETNAGTENKSELEGSEAEAEISEGAKNIPDEEQQDTCQTSELKDADGASAENEISDPAKPNIEDHEQCNEGAGPPHKPTGETAEPQVETTERIFSEAKKGSDAEPISHPDIVHDQPKEGATQHEPLPVDDKLSVGPDETLAGVEDTQEPKCDQINTGPLSTKEKFGANGRENSETSVDNSKMDKQTVETPPTEMETRDQLEGQLVDSDSEIKTSPTVGGEVAATSNVSDQPSITDKFCLQTESPVNDKECKGQHVAIEEEVTNKECNTPESSDPPNGGLQAKEAKPTEKEGVLNGESVDSGEMICSSLIDLCKGDDYRKNTSENALPVQAKQDTVIPDTDRSNFGETSAGVTTDDGFTLGEEEESETGEIELPPGAEEFVLDDSETDQDRKEDLLNDILGDLGMAEEVVDTAHDVSTKIAADPSEVDESEAEEPIFELKNVTATTRVLIPDEDLKKKGKNPNKWAWSGLGKGASNKSIENSPSSGQTKWLGFGKPITEDTQKDVSAPETTLTQVPPKPQSPTRSSKSVLQAPKKLSDIEKARLYAASVLLEAEETKEKPQESNRGTLGTWFSKSSRT